MKKLIFLFCLFNVFSIYSEPYIIKKLGMEKGLSNNYITDIAEDKNGYLWFATEEGLNKLEGNHFTSFYKNEHFPLNLTGNELNCLFDDQTEPVLWIGTQRAGLNAFNYQTNQQTIYQHDDKNPSSIATNDVTGIYAASDGNLWITTYWRGIEHLDKKSGKFTHYNQQTVPGLPSNTIWTLLDDHKGNLYIGHAHNGLSILSIRSKEIKNFIHDDSNNKTLPSNNVQCIFKDNTGNIWVGTDKGLALFQHDTEDFIRLNQEGSPLSHRIYDIQQFNENQLWIATEFGGIVIIDLSKSLFDTVEKVQSIHPGDSEYTLNNATVRCLFQDSHQNIWAGTWGGGVNFLSSDNSLFKSFRYSPGLPEGNLNSHIASAVCIDAEGALWVGTDGGGINVLTHGKRTATYTAEDGTISGNSIQTALCDKKGNLWFGVFYGGIMYYDTHTRTFRQIFPKEQSAQDVRSLFEDKEGIIWVGTSEGVFQIDRDSKKILKHINVPDNLVRTVIKDKKGQIWIGSFGGGIFVYTSQGKLLKQFNTYLHFPSNTINQLFEDSSGKIWAATGEGLIQLESKSPWHYKAYQRKEGLANSYIWAITEDKAGNIWFSTNKGISCLTKEKGNVYNYNNKDNIPIASFTGGSVCQDSKGRIFFGSTDGVCNFQPGYVLEKRLSPKAIIGKMTIFEPLTSENNHETVVSLINTDQIKLKNFQNNFTISFNISNYALNERVEYAYMLKGFENSWYTVKGPNFVTFHSLPPGTYQFLIKTRIRNQEWSNNISSLEIVIAPPLWLSWWAKLLYVIAGIGLLIGIFLVYKHKLTLEYLYEAEKKNHEHEQKLNNERLRFFTNITHELRTPLTLILGPLQDMVNSNTLSAKDQHRISVIYQSAVRLLNLINQILDFRKTETQNKKLCVTKGNLSHAVYETGLKYKELNNNPNVQILIEVEEEHMILFFDKEVIMMILDNLISNALKYTEKGYVRIRAEWVTENDVRYAQLSVEDTGYGIGKEALAHVFERYYQESGEHQASGTGIGLALVKNLVTLHEGDIQVKSQPNIGTTFYLRLQANNTYPNALHGEDAHAETPAAKEDSIEKPELPEPPKDTRPIVLVVEDNADIRDYIADAFTDLYEVKTASNGKEGLKIATECTPDIVVSDIMMPVMNGIIMCQKLKTDIRTSHIPVILLTAKDSITDKEEGYQAGADSYLTKPFSASLLQSRISNLLAQRRRLSERFSIRPEKAQRQSMEEKRAIITESMNKLDKEFLDKITNTITEGLAAAENVDITVLSNALCMSSSTLYRKVKALTGMSTNEYIRKIKMQLAEKYLLEGKYTISEIAFKVGINSSVYFRQCFKEEFGMSASEYLKQLTGKSIDENTDKKES